MTSRTLFPGDVGVRSSEHYHHSSDGHCLNEPLLGNHDPILDGTHSKMQVLKGIWAGPRTWSLHWTLIILQLVMQWAHWIVHAVLGSGYAVGQFLFFPSSISNGLSKKMILPPLTPLQAERLRALKQRLQTPFNSSLAEHQDALRKLWRLAYPDRKLPSLKTELWKEMGWQGVDPATDFRGGGFASLENLIYFATKYPESFQRLLHKKDGVRAEWEYPFAVSGINISFMLVQMLDLQSDKTLSSAGVKFLSLLKEDDMAFDNLYCVAFQMMDAQWLAQHATYMQFSDVLKSTRNELERELKLQGISTIKDLPAYKLLKK